MLPIVRPATPEDAQGILLLLRELAAERNRPVPALDEDGLTAMAFGPRATFRCLLVTSAGRVVAAAFVYPGFNPLDGTRGMHMADIFVDPAQRRHSLGRSLAAAAARHCREEGGTWLSWSVENGQEGAYTFCEHLRARPMRLHTPMLLEGEAFEDLADTSL